MHLVVGDMKTFERCLRQGGVNGRACLSCNTGSGALEEGRRGG